MQRVQGRTAAAILIQEAEAAANATLQQNFYDLTAFNFTQHNRLLSYKNLQTKMGYNGSALLDYVKVTAADQNSDGAIISMGGKGFGM